jgi:hypothetical protein
MRFVQYPFFRCSLAKLMDPSELIKARWVRPEPTGRDGQTAYLLWG